MMEQDYLDMVGQLKDKYDEITSKLEKIERRDKQICKEIITSYGVVRLLDHLIDTNPIGYDNEVVVLVEMLRGVLSDCVDKHILI